MKVTFEPDTGSFEHRIRPVDVSLNVTVEVGAVPECGRPKVAVKVTSWFTKEGAGEEAKVNVSVAGLTVRIALLELGPKFESPLYAAVTV